MTTASSTIPTADLQVGMFVHLDLGWMSHPFALSSFRIADAGQIATIRALGLARVRWSPERSAQRPAGASVTPPPAAAQAPGAAPADAASSPALPPAPVAATPASAASDAEVPARRAAAELVERQYAEATGDWRAATDLLQRDPLQAGKRLGALSQALVNKMLGARELSIRAVTATATEDASHALNVGVLALLMGRLCGLSDTELDDLGAGALAHDLGKTELPPALHKADANFSSDEMALCRSHVTRGTALGERMGLTPGALLVIAQHHEHMDGSGYPLGLEGHRISMPARIAALVNRYDGLCHPGKRTLPMTPHESVSWLYAQGQRQYDPGLLSAFVRMMGVYPPGSVVQLTDDRYAVVESVSASRPLKPCVQVHDPSDAEQPLQMIDLSRQRGLGIRRALPQAQLPSAVRQHLLPQRLAAWFFEASDDDTPSGFGMHR